jgi:hypothetical protein
MSEKNEKDAAGKALYLEFRKSEYTYQFILTPTLVGRTNDETPHEPYLLLRRISSYTPRRNWSFFTAGRIGTTRGADGAFEHLTSPDALSALIGTQATVFKNYSSQLAGRGYKLHKNPIFVEVSFKDLESIRSKKTPNDLYRRILRSRDAFAFGEVVVEPVTV